MNKGDEIVANDTVTKSREDIIYFLDLDIFRHPFLN